MTYDERRLVHKEIQKLKQEMDAMWEHIRNLEEKLLAPQEHKVIPGLPWSALRCSAICKKQE